MNFRPGSKSLDVYVATEIRIRNPAVNDKAQYIPKKCPELYKNASEYRCKKVRKC